jgi:hypothetical protein
MEAPGLATRDIRTLNTPATSSSPVSRRATRAFSKRISVGLMDWSRCGRGAS